MRGSKFKFFVLIFPKLKEIIIYNQEWWQPLKIVRLFLHTISHTCRAIKSPWGVAINIIYFVVNLWFKTVDSFIKFRKTHKNFKYDVSQNSFCLNWEYLSQNNY